MNPSVLTVVFAVILGLQLITGVVTDLLLSIVLILLAYLGALKQSVSDFFDRIAEDGLIPALKRLFKGN